MADSEPVRDEHDLIAIFRFRLRMARRRQRRHFRELLQLARFLKQRDLPHPFTLHADHLEVLRELSCYQRVLAGLEVSCPVDRYLYRITTVGALTWSIAWNEQDSLPEEPKGPLWSRIKEASGEPPEWVPLRHFGSGAYEGRRGVSWWSTLPNITDDLIRAAYRLGVASNYIGPNSVVLRVPAASGNVTRVPTVLDALDMPIFLPTRENDAPSSGITIDVGNNPDLAEGDAEYVLGPVPVDDIEIFPVLVDERAWRAYRGPTSTAPAGPAWSRVALGRQLYGPLMSFYQRVAS
jgi:hypothetical protein